MSTKLTCAVLLVLGLIQSLGNETLRAADRYLSRQARPYNGPYQGEYLNQIAFPLGGIGAGMVCLEGNGCLSHVSIRHQPQFGCPLECRLARW